MRNNKKHIIAVAALAFLVAIACSNNTYADATNINVSTQEDWYAALITMHASTNSEFTITLTNDVDITTAINSQYIDNKNTVTIIGNGHSLTFDVDAGKINVSDATLNLGRNGQNDVLKIKGGGPSKNSSNPLISLHADAVLNMYANTELSDNYHNGSALTGAGVLMDSNSKFYMYGGSIHDNSARTWGGGVSLDGTNGAEFHMYGGEIYNNSVEDYYGSAIMLAYGTGVADIQGGTIRNNSAPWGGAITSIEAGFTVTINNVTIKNNVGIGTYAGGTMPANYGGAAIINRTGTMTITNSIIEGNSYAKNAGCGGLFSTATIISENNIYRNNTGSYGGAYLGYRDTNNSSVSNLTSTNDKIYENTASSYGGGAFLFYGSADLSSSEVYNNKAAGAGNDYFIYQTFTSAKIIPAVSMTGYATYGTVETNLENWYRDAGTRFTVDNPTAIVDPANIASGSQYALTAAGKVVYTLHFETDGGSTIDDQKVIVNNMPTEPTDPTKAGYTFEGWFTDDTHATRFDFSAAMTDHATAYAKWAAVPAPDPAPAPEPIPDSPATGDDITIYIHILGVSILGFAAAYSIRKK